MAITVSNTNLNDSFNTWRLNGNEVATILANNIVTVARAGSADRKSVTVGNGHIKGTFTANELRTTTLKSGNTSDNGGWLNVNSNTSINATSLAITSNTTFQGNVIISTSGAQIFNLGNISRMRISGGSAGQFLRKSGSNKLDFEPLTLRQVTDLSSNSAHLILSGANTSFAEVAAQSPHLKFANANDAIEVYLSGGAGGTGTSDLYLNLADASGASRLNIADSANAVVTYIDSDGKISTVTLDVSGATTLNGDVTLGDADTDTITVKGKFANQATTGTASFNGTSNFNGTTNMNGTLNINGNVNIGDAAADSMNVTATASLNGNTTIGDSVADTLTVNSRLASNFVANGSYTLGTSSLRWATGYLTRLDAATINASGLTTIAGLHANGNIDTDGTLTVDSTATVSGTTNLNGDVNLGDAQTDTITVKGKFANQSTTGTATFNGDVILGNATADTITVKGNLANQHTEGTATFGGKVGIGATPTTGFDLETGNSAKVGENLTVSGNTSINGNLDVSGTITFPADSAFEVANAIFGSLVVNGNTSLGDSGDDIHTVTGTYNSSLVPKTGSRQSIGSGSSAWHNVYANNITVNDEMTVTNKLTVTKNVVVSGNLTVSGTTTTVNSETVNIADNIIKLNSNASGAPTEDAGIAINRGTSANAELRWDESNDYWKIHTGGTYTGRIVTTGDTASGGALADYYQVANTNTLLADKMSVANTQALYTTLQGNSATWSALTGTNTAIRTLVSDRMQVANTQALHTSITANLNSYIANTNPRITNILSSVSSTNTAIRTLVSDRMQVANVISYTAKYLEVANSSATDTSTLATWTELLATNTAIRTLVSDRMQVANTIALANARLGATASVTLTGDVSGSASFSSNAVSISTTIADDSHNHIIGNVDGLQTALNNKMSVANTQALANARLGATASITLTGDVAGSGSFSSNSVSIALTQQNNSVDLGTHTTGNYVATISGTTNQVNVSGSGSETAAVTLSLPQSIATSSDVQFDSFGVGTAASGTTGEVRATNNVTAYYSDARLKNFLGNIDNALDKVNALNGYFFEENEKAKELGYDNDDIQVGVSAQEVEAVLPQVVTDAPINANVEGADYKTVYYDKLVPLLIEAIKELSAKVDKLENK